MNDTADEMRADAAEMAAASFLEKQFPGKGLVLFVWDRGTGKTRSISNAGRAEVTAMLRKYPD